MNALKKKVSLFILPALLIFENLLLFIFNSGHILSSAVNAVCLSLCSILIGIMLILKFYGQSIKITNTKNNKGTIVTILLLLAGVIWLSIKIKYIFSIMPVNPTISDIIPAIEAMVKAFLSGNNPYGRDTILHLGYAAPSPYMPMHWMPYISAELLHIDYRWITFSIWILAVLILVRRSSNIPDIWSMILNITLLFCVYFLITDKHQGSIGMTVETMVAGYYMILIAGLNIKNPWLHAITIAICLMSRYTLALWLPLWAFVLYLSGNKTHLLKAIVTITAILLILYIIPYMSRDWAIFYDSHMVYEKGAIFEWSHTDGNNVPYHLFNGTGLAQFFYTAYHNADLHIGYQLLQTTMFVSIGVSLLLMALWYWYHKHKIDYRIFLMASFKIYLSIFLACIMVPYLYLMIVGNFVSIAIFMEQQRYRHSD